MATALLGALAAGGARADEDTAPYAGISLEQLYDSNVQNSRGPDAVTRVTPRLGLLVRGPRLTLDADYRLGIHTYAQGAAENSFNHRAALVGRAALTPRLGVDTRIVFLDASDPIVLDRPAIAVPQGSFTDLDAHVGTSYRVTRRLTFDAAYLYRRSRFDLAQAGDPLAFDGDEHRVDLDLAYRVTRRWTAKVLARGQHFVSAAAADSLGEAAGGGLALQYALGPLTTAQIAGGPIWFDRGGTTWFALAEVMHRGERSRFALRAVRDIYGGTSAAESVWADSVQLEGRFRLMRRMDLRVRGSAYRNGPAPSEDANVSGLVGRADLGWALFENTRIELYGEHRSQSVGGGLAFGDLSRTVVGVRLVAIAGANLFALGDSP